MIADDMGDDDVKHIQRKSRPSLLQAIHDYGEDPTATFGAELVGCKPRLWWAVMTYDAAQDISDDEAPDQMQHDDVSDNDSDRLSHLTCTRCRVM